MHMYWGIGFTYLADSVWDAQLRSSRRSTFVTTSCVHFLRRRPASRSPVDLFVALIIWNTVYPYIFFRTLRTRMTGRERRKDGATEGMEECRKAGGKKGG